MSFAAPAMSDTSSVNSKSTEALEREFQQVNDEYDCQNDYHNDSGCDSLPAYVRFPSTDRIDQMSVWQSNCFWKVRLHKASPTAKILTF